MIPTLTLMHAYVSAENTGRLKTPQQSQNQLLCHETNNTHGLLSQEHIRNIVRYLSFAKTTGLATEYTCITRISKIPGKVFRLSNLPTITHTDTSSSSAHLSSLLLIEGVPFSSSSAVGAEEGVTVMVKRGRMVSVPAEFMTV